MTTPWPFHTWGLDLIRPINPPSNGHIWILVVTEYFTKWVEVIPLKKATGTAVANFIWEHIITWFRIPRMLISDNGTPFINKDMNNLTKHQGNHLHNTPNHPWRHATPQILFCCLLQQTQYQQSPSTLLRRSREETRIRNSADLSRTNKVQEGLLNSSPIASKATGSKDPLLGVWHHKLRAPPWPVREGLEP